MRKAVSIALSLYVTRSVAADVDKDWQNWDKNEQADIYDAPKIKAKLIDGYRQYANTYNIPVDDETEHQLEILGDSLSEMANTSRDAQEKYQANKVAFD